MSQIILNKNTRYLKFILIFFSIFALAVFVFFIFSNSYFAKHPINNVLSTEISSENLCISEASFLNNPGAAYFKNLLVVKQHFCFASPISDQSKGAVEQLLNEEGQYNFDIRSCSLDDIKNFSKFSKVQFFEGTTLIFSASNEMKIMQSHHFHFFEEFLIAWSIYKKLNGGTVKTIIFPARNHWQEHYQEINAKVLYALFPNVQIINADQLKKLSDKNILQFEQAIFVDRHACHKNELAQKYNKMLLGHLDLIDKKYIQELRALLYQKFKTYTSMQSKPLITYIKRKGKRQLEPNFEKKFLQTLSESFPSHTINPVYLENMSFAEQLQTMRNTHILISAHGNGLTNELFLPDNSLVIELFPKGAYSMDYQLFAELCGHTYYGIDPDKGIVATIGSRIPFKGPINLTIEPLNETLITSLISDYLSCDTAPGLNETSSNE